MRITLPGDGPVLCFGGPYSNLEATRALRTEARQLGIPAELLNFTGYIYANSATPIETPKENLDWCGHDINGNGEEQHAASPDTCAFGYVAETT